MINTEPTLRQHLASILLASALVFLPWSKTACHISLILYIILWLTEGSFRKKLEIFKTNVVLLILTSWLLLSASKVILGCSIFIIEKNAFLFALPVCIITSNVRLSQQNVRVMLYAFSVSCILVLVYCFGTSIYQWNSFNNNLITFQQIDFLNSSNYFATNPDVSKNWVFFTYIGLSNGANLHPSYLSLYLGFSIVFLLTESSREQLFKHQQIVNTSVIVFFLVSLVLLSSRIIIFGVTAILVMFVVYDLQARRSKKQVFFSALLLIGIVAGVFLNPISRQRNWNELTNMSYAISYDTTYRTSSEIRASLWWLGWKSFQTVNPIWGSGSQDVEAVMKVQSEKYQITNVLQTLDPHNQFLHTLIANGLAGLTLLISLLVWGFVVAIREKQIVMLTFLFLFTALCLTESALELQKGIVFFSILFPLFINRKVTESIATSSLTSFAGVRN